ncbi:MAG: nucleotidyl transferase AbiEii/AbiGii toxin family protein [Lachnospiraceae bacterium]|nr:nucleotidyl transferase AbiEii/AbiGii toxin family protein [Lachnospiraceae bacterium]
MNKTDELTLESSSLFDIKNRIKQETQDKIMCALAHSGFLDKAVLHGDKARRIHYELDGLSGHPEFSLMEPDPDFQLNTLLDKVKKELLPEGFEFKEEIREKPTDTNVKTAVLKGNTKELARILLRDNKMLKTIPDSDTTHIRFEVNTAPPLGAGYERKKLQYAGSYEITLYDKPSLFAEKIDNTISRAWRNRTRGCDLYDYAFYLSNNVPVNLKHLITRLLYSRYVEAKEDMTLEEVKANLCYRFREINYQEAKIDLLPFIKDPESLDLWSPEYFCAITQKLKAQ